MANVCSRVCLVAGQTATQGRFFSVEFMTFKIFHGLVGAGSAKAPTASSTSVKEGRFFAAQTAAGDSSFGSEAVTTTVYTAARKVVAGETISSIDRARDVAVSIADQIRAYGEHIANESMGEIGYDNVFKHIY